MILCAEGALTQPLLYLSLYFKQYRNEYYQALQRVRTDGDWEGWMSYYLDGVDWTARQAITTTTELLELFSVDRERFSSAVRGAATLRVYEELQKNAIVSIRRVTEALGITVPISTAALIRLQPMGIAREITGKGYGRLFAYQSQLDVINRTD